jgi:ABC-type protease/lipase transport system fused ATPase/permease subunit
VVITHRPQLLSQVDKIVLMQNGRAVRFGHRDEILPLLLQARAPTQPTARPRPAAGWKPNEAYQVTRMARS